MTKAEFREIFLRALNGAAEDVEVNLEKPISRSFIIELYAPGSSGRHLTVDEALDQIYLGSDLFYRIIDISIKKLLPNASVAFVRVSGHEPNMFSKTWNPSDMGPFKKIVSETVEDRSVPTG